MTTPEQDKALAILRDFATLSRLPFGLRAAVGWLESKWDWYAVGDQGKACGLIQVRSDIHGHDCAWWSGDDGARRSLELMAWRWRDAFTRLGDGWTGRSREEQAAYLRDFQPAAQGSSVPSMARCREAVAMAVGVEAQEPRPMVDKPPIIFIQAAAGNINVRPPGVVYEGLVVHTTGGSVTIEQLGAWFGGRNLKQGLPGSTHFGVDRDGRIGQFVSLDQQPIAHGAESASTAAILRGNEGISTNAYLIGVEHLDGGVPGSVTDVQLEASAWLMAWLWETEIVPHTDRTGAVLDRDHLLKHSELAPSSKARCPSWSEERMTAHLARIAARLAGTVPQPPVDPRDEQIRQLTASKIGLRDGYTLTLESLRAERQAAQNMVNRLDAAIRGAETAIQKWGS